MFKKFGLIMVFVLTLLFVGNINVNALTEAQLYEKIIKNYTMDNGTVFGLSAAQKVEAERYFNINDISNDDATYIGQRIDDAINIVNRSGAKNIDDLTNSEKDAIKGIIVDISRNTSVFVSWVGNNEVAIYNQDETLFAKGSLNVIKRTGNDNSVIYVGICVLSLLFAGIVLNKKFAKEA